MVKRVVDTAFWTDMQVIDNYSVEDKYFYLYLLTNDKSTQVGIYSLPLKVMSFETGYTGDVIKVLLDRFSEKYKQILYSFISKSHPNITLLVNTKLTSELCVLASSITSYSSDSTAKNFSSIHCVKIYSFFKSLSK